MWTLSRLKIPMRRLFCSSRVYTNRTVAQISQCTDPIPTMHPFVTECAHVCTFLLLNGALWDVCLMRCGICGMVLYSRSQEISTGSQLYFALLYWHLAPVDYTHIQHGCFHGIGAIIPAMVLVSCTQDGCNNSAPVLKDLKNAGVGI